MRVPRAYYSDGRLGPSYDDLPREVLLNFAAGLTGSGKKRWITELEFYEQRRAIAAALAARWK